MKRIGIIALASFAAFILVQAGNAQDAYVTALNPDTCRYWLTPDGRSECR